MYKVGLTGGIGSGKTTVAKVFKQLGVSVYSSDDMAKAIMVSNTDLVLKITELFGVESYTNGSLNRAFIAAKVFSDSTQLKLLNAIVHPALKMDFELWCLAQKGTYRVKEAAILFESKAHLGLDKVILVSAPEDLRINRVLKRDSATKEAVKLRMDKQWSDAKKRSLADFEIVNDEKESILTQVIALHNNLNKPT